MLVAPLSSGSAGNSYYVESDGTAILLDAGLGPRETKKRVELIGAEFSALRAIVITHEHSDHVHGAGSIARKLRIPLYMTEGTLNATSIDLDEVETRIFPNNSSFEIGNLLIHARRTMHDAADPACFVIEGRDGSRVGLASDLGHVDEAVLRHLTGLDGLFFEANHDLDMLRTGSYPWSLKRRIMSNVGHLSNDDAMLAVERMLTADTKTLCLIHLSQKNNHESIVREMAATLLDRLGAQMELSIAQQFEPTGRFEISRRAPRRPPVARSASPQMALF